MNRWAVLALLFFVRTSMGFQFQSVPAVSPLFLKDFVIGIADLGLLIGLYHAPGIALAIPGGSVGRRFGDATGVAIGLVLMAFGTLLMAAIPDWNAQIAGRLVAGVGAVFINVLMAKMVADWFAGRELATAMGIFVNSWPFGVALGLAVFPVLAGQGGILAVHGAALGLIIAGLAGLITLYRPPPAAAAPAPTATPTQALAGWPVGRPLAAVLTAGLIWGFYNAAIGVTFGFGTLILTERAWSLEAAGLATSVVLWAMVVSVPLGGMIADRFRQPIGVILVSCLAFALLLSAATRIDVTSWMIFPLIGLLGGLAAGPIMSLPARVLGAETRALGMGLFFTMFYAMQAAGPWLAGRLSAWRGDAAAAFDAGAAFLVVTMGLVYVFLLLSARPSLARKASLP